MDLSNCKLIESCKYRARQGISLSPESNFSNKVKRQYRSGRVSVEKPKINDSRLAWSEKKTLNSDLQEPKPIHLEISSRRFFIIKLTPLEVKSSSKPLKGKVYDHLANTDAVYPLNNYFRPNSLTPMTVNNKKFFASLD